MSEKPSLLEIHDLGVVFANSPKPAVEHASFSLDKGETVALVGESGSGKTVTALSILQLLPYPLARHPAGSSIKFAGEELIGAPAERLRQIR
ncbi:MAG TPA: ATP-binding cassette domain-containing protein, partial [Candidatus Polarisedimenticolia bacterium]|nr:ATP-binding cassette domain-containing protein [Candidatus Polarisedimenticolia bacterium]